MTRVARPSVSGLASLMTSDQRDAERRAAARLDIQSDRGLFLLAMGGLAWLLASAVALDVTDGATTGGLLVQSLFYLLPMAGAAALSGVVARRSAGRDRVFWGALAASCVLWLAGEAVWADQAAAGTLQAARGWVATALHLASYVPALLAALFLCGRPSAHAGARGLFDTVVVGLAVAFLGYEQEVLPALASHSSTTVVLDSTYPVLGAIVVLVALSVGVEVHRFVPLPRLLITTSFACSMLLDGCYSQLVNVRGYDGHWLNLGWEFRAGLICLAAATALRHAEIGARVRTLPSSWGIGTVLAACLGVIYVVGTDTLARRTSSLTLFAGGSAVLALVARGLLAFWELHTTAVGLERARTEQERLAVTDGLTGLYNRRFFEEFLSLEADRSLRHGSPLSLIVVDLDHFKRVNDTLGHPAGDAVLVETARRLTAVVRDSDVVARYGGEEFVVVLPEADPDAALEVAERCRSALDQSPVQLSDRRPTGGDVVRVTGSLGVATLWSISGLGVGDLVRAADRALYRAKASGRNRVAPAGDWDFRTATETATGTATETATATGTATEIWTDTGSGRSPVTGAPADSDPVLVSLLRAADLVDADQSGDEHATAIARWAAVIADSLDLDPPTRDRVVLASRLHDVGKLAIPRSVLTKAGRLSAAEWALLQTHPAHSSALVALSPVTADLGPLVRAHHERFDGTGYPDQLTGTAIPIEARIISVCDSWAAMRATRVYAPARSVEDCRRELVNGRGGQFDPDITDTFLRFQRAGVIGDLATVSSAPERVRDRHRGVDA